MFPNIGSDWEGKFDYLNEYCKVIYLPRTLGISSSDIRAKNRKLRIGTVGNGSVCNKFIREIQYVNGVEYVECDEIMENVDAVYIATHPDRHYEDVKRALEAGKHVICESPIAKTVSQFEELSGLAKKNGLILEDGIKTASLRLFASWCWWSLSKAPRII